jgi:hypothetical protein
MEPDSLPDWCMNPYKDGYTLGNHISKLERAPRSRSNWDAAAPGTIRQPQLRLPSLSNNGILN